MAKMDVKNMTVKMRSSNLHMWATDQTLIVDLEETVKKGIQ